MLEAEVWLLSWQEWACPIRVTVILPNAADQ
uniref:Uncharacterized protein n=1 Tax=Anguilla anguilla TaxID=7936 RepID=A0A0E9QTW1_ANGAN